MTTEEKREDAFEAAWRKYDKGKGIAGGWEKIGFVGGFGAGFAAGRLSGLQQAAEIADVCRDVTAAHIAACIREKIAKESGQ